MTVPWEGESLLVEVSAEGDTMAAQCVCRELLDAILVQLKHADSTPELMLELIRDADGGFLE